MSRILITGCAGFIGSNLAEKLIEGGYYVVGVDCFTDYYSSKLKQFNLNRLLANSHFQLIRLDISEASFNQLTDIVRQVEYVVHEAAQPGVRKSWGTDFKDYVRHNIIATQKLVEAVSKAESVKRFIFASSSSVYGNVGNVRLREDALSKLA
ncbi:MAG: GDP-mannose 4,6-dehydratase [Candidatus Nezhaarchaeota archaeon]|nr:GDP-mannose 4,6-dehydratase [Candidatus Nezhaarchaeota archaeon]